MLVSNWLTNASVKDLPSQEVSGHFLVNNGVLTLNKSVKKVKQTSTRKNKSSESCTNNKVQKKTKVGE